MLSNCPLCHARSFRAAGFAAGSGFSGGLLTTASGFGSGLGAGATGIAAGFGAGVFAETNANGSGFAKGFTGATFTGAAFTGAALGGAVFAISGCGAAAWGCAGETDARTGTCFRI